MKRVIWAITLLAVASSPLAACTDVEIRTRLPLSLGTLTVLPGASGFLELHPDYGLAISKSSGVHSGHFGLGEFEIIGPIRAQLELMLKVIKMTDQPHAYLELAEVITQAHDGVMRLSRHGGRVVVRMPDYGSEVGRARLLLPVGAVMRFSYSAQREKAEYRVVVDCIEMGRY